MSQRPKSHGQAAQVASLTLPAFTFATATPQAKTAPLLHDIHLEIMAGQTVCLMGQSGSGKSTLLSLLAGLIPLPKDGHKQLPRTADGRESLSLMAQDTALLPWLTTIENITFGDRLRGVSPDLERAHTLLEHLGLTPWRTHHPYELSGGLRQRVAIGRTLYENATLILLDEPFSALDALTRRQIQTLSRALLVDKSVFMVTHDPMEALMLADRIFILARGTLTPFQAPDLTTEQDRALASIALMDVLLEQAL